MVDEVKQKVEAAPPEQLVEYAKTGTPEEQAIAKAKIAVIRATGSPYFGFGLSPEEERARTQELHRLETTGRYPTEVVTSPMFVSKQTLLPTLPQPEMYIKRPLTERERFEQYVLGKPSPQEQFQMLVSPPTVTEPIYPVATSIGGMEIYRTPSGMMYETVSVTPEGEISLQPMALPTRKVREQKIVTEEMALQRLAATMPERPLHQIIYGTLYDPFGFRQTIAATAVRLRGGTREEALRAAFEAGAVGFYKTAYYKPTELAAQFGISAFFWTAPVAAIKAPVIGKVATTAFKALTTYQAIELAREPSLERLIGVSTALGTYAAMRVVPKIAQRFVKPRVAETRTKVEYVAEKKAVIAEQVKEYRVGYESARELTTYYGKLSKEMANAVFIQKEAAGGIIRTIVTPEGRVVTPPKGIVKFKYGLYTREMMTLGTGIPLEYMPKELPYGAYPIKEFVITEKPSVIAPFKKTVKVGILIDEKSVVKFVQPADIQKTPLKKTFPMPTTEMKILAGMKGLEKVVSPPVAELKAVPMRLETVKGTAVITGFEEIPRIFPQVVPPTTIAPTRFREYQVQAKFPKQWEYTLPTGRMITKPITEEERKLKYLQQQEQKQEKIQIRMQKQKQELEQRVTPSLKTLVVPEQAQAQLKRQEQQLKQKQKQLEKQLTTQIQIPRQDIPRVTPKKEVPPPDIILPKVPKGKMRRFRKPKMVRFYPSGKRRRRYKIVPRAGLLSLGTEMTEGIKRGRFIYPKHPRPTKKVKKRFLRQIREKLAVMEFPTAAMYEKGKELKFNIGIPPIKNILPQFRKRKRRRRK